MKTKREDLEGLAREHILVPSPTVPACEAFLGMAREYPVDVDDVINFARAKARATIERDRINRQMFLDTLRSRDWWND